MLEWLIPAAASFAGSMFTNRSNRNEAERNREFQERMSGSAAQRAQRDFQAAGLNPALAYGNPASSPAGSMSQAEDSMGRGISSAMRAKELHGQLANMQADVKLKDANAAKAAAEGATSIKLGDLYQAQLQETLRGTAFKRTTEPYERNALRAESLLKEYATPKAEMWSRMWNAPNRALDFSARQLDNLHYGLTQSGARDSYLNLQRKTQDALRIPEWMRSGKPR